jgi:hypothetical protein
MKIQLIKIHLRRACNHKGADNGHSRTDHPDIRPGKQEYLVRYAGRFYAGTFEVQWYGLNFNGIYDAGAQFDAPGTNASRWQDVWEIRKEE